MVGRLPSNTRNGCCAGGEPSAATCSCSLAESERLGLSEHVRHQQVMLMRQRAQRLHEADEIARDQLRPLMDQLVERMLAVRARARPR